MLIVSVTFPAAFINLCERQFFQKIILHILSRMPILIFSRSLTFANSPILKNSHTNFREFSKFAKVNERGSFCARKFLRAKVSVLKVTYAHTYSLTSHHNNFIMYVRKYACTYVRMYICMHVRMYICMYVCTHVRMYVYVCTYVLMCAWTCVRICTYGLTYTFCVYICKEISKETPVFFPLRHFPKKLKRQTPNKSDSVENEHPCASRYRVMAS